MEPIERELHPLALEHVLSGGELPSGRAVYRAGRFSVELLQFASARPLPDDHRIGDAGFYHLALRHPTRGSIASAYRGLLAAGGRANCPPVELGLATILYARAPAGIGIVEHLRFCSVIGRFIGFRPAKGRA
jgi:hypothetical protein